MRTLKNTIVRGRRGLARGAEDGPVRGKAARALVLGLGTLVLAGWLAGPIGAAPAGTHSGPHLATAGTDGESSAPGDSAASTTGDPTMGTAIEALAQWGRCLAGVPAERMSPRERARKEAVGRQYLDDLVTLAALAEPADWDGAESIRALREAAVGASRSLRESLALGAIELAQLAPTPGQRTRHLLGAARLAEPLTFESTVPHGSGEAVAPAAPSRGSAQDWRGVIARIHDQITSAQGTAPRPVTRAAARARGAEHRRAGSPLRGPRHCGQ